MKTLHKDIRKYANFEKATSSDLEKVKKICLPKTNQERTYSWDFRSLHEVPQSLSRSLSADFHDVLTSRPRPYTLVAVDKLQQELLGFVLTENFKTYLRRTQSEFLLHKEFQIQEIEDHGTLRIVHAASHKSLDTKIAVQALVQHAMSYAKQSGLDRALVQLTMRAESKTPSSVAYEELGFAHIGEETRHVILYGRNTEFKQHVYVKEL